MRSRLGLDDAYHKLGRGRVGRQQIVCLEEIPRGDVAHAESDGRDGLSAEEREEIVIATASEKRAAIVVIGIKYLKNHPCVVIKAAGDRGVDYHVAHAQVFKRDAQLFEVGGGRDVLELLDELYRLLFMGNECGELLFEIVDFRAAVEESGDATHVLLCDADGLVDGVENAPVRDTYLKVALVGSERSEERR